MCENFRGPKELPKPSLSEPQLMHENPFYKVVRIRAEFSRFAKDYYVSIDGARAGVVAVSGEGVLLVRQYRLLIDGYSLEIPGGSVRDGESPEETAVRECLEETGVACHRLVPLIHYMLALDIRDNQTYLYYSREVSPPIEGVFADNEESVECLWVPLEQCIRMIFAGEIRDSFTIIALLAYANRIESARQAEPPEGLRA